MAPIIPIADDCQVEPILADLDEKAAHLPEADRSQVLDDLRRLRELFQNQQHLLEARRGTEAQGAFPQAGEILESITDAFFAVDAGWRLTYVNQRAEQWWRRTRESLLGTVVWDMFPGYEQTKAYQEHQRAMCERVPAHFETFSPNLHTWVEAHVYPASNGGLSTYFRDITERKRMEEALADSERRYREIIEYAPTAIYEIDFRTGQFTTVNDSLVELTGYSREELLQMKASDMLDEQSKLLFQQRVRQWLSGEKPDENVEYRVTAKDGHTIYAVLSATFTWDEEGRPLGATVIGHDITARKLAEDALRDSDAALRQSEAKFRGAFDNAAIGFAMTDANGRILDVNPAYCKLTGYSAEELREFLFSQLIHPEDYAENMVLIDRIRAGEIRDFVIENRYIRKDGQVVWVRKSVSLVRGADGAPQAIVALVEDITERRRFEQALRESELIYRAIGESIDYGVWICAPDGRNTYASQSLLDLVGITQQQCSDFGWGDSLHPDDAERTIAAWKECVRTEGVWDIEHRYMGKDGKYHPILARGVPVRNEKGEIFCWAGINLDISRLKQTEQALRESQEHFQVALKNSPMVVYTTDRDLRYTWVYNPAFGIGADQLIGKTDEEINQPEEVRELSALKRRVLESGVGNRQEITLGYQGETYYYDVTVEPLRDDHGEVTGLTVAAIDITEKKRLEQARIQDQIQIALQRRVMEQRELDRQSIARDIHDGPVQSLSSTLFNIQFAKEAFSDPLLNAELDQIALNVKNATQELRQVIYELRPPSVIRFGIAQAIRFHAEDLRERNPELKVQLHLENIGTTLSEMTCLTLYRIYQEAITNALRHSGANKVWVRLSIKGSSIILQIRDNGKGMPAEHNIDSLTKNGHFGLAGMKERVDVLKGELTVASQPGKGTNIHVIVPMQENSID